MTARCRIYSETLPHADVTRPDVLGMLATRGIELVLAVRPWDVRGLPEIVRAVSGSGVSLSLWPMLDDRAGRWASAANADRFVAFARAVAHEAERASASQLDLLVDLEPPIHRVGMAGASLGAWAAGRRGFAHAEGVFAGLARELTERGMSVSAAVWPPVSLDPEGARGWQRLLGTPVDALGDAHVSVMLYTSLLSGWSGSLLRRRHALELLEGGARRALARYGPRAGVSLGCVGTGAFETEPVYASPAELAEDVRVARAAGVTSLALFDLGGVLARPPASPWLDALVGVDVDGPAQVGRSRRLAVARRIARTTTAILGRRRSG